MYCLDVIVSMRCLFHPPKFFDSTDAIFQLINQYMSIRDSLVGYPPILGSMGVGKSERNPSELLVAPGILCRSLGGTDNGLALWDNSSNLLKK